MKEQFIERNFRSKNSQRIGHINDILEEYFVRQGYPLTSRGVCYKLLTKNIITGHEFEPTEILISKARKAGKIDWDAIIDSSREMICNSHWDSPKDILDACSTGFQIDKWATQPNYVELMVEKQALQGILLPVCQELDIPFTANIGFISDTTLKDAVKKRYLLRRNAGKTLFLIYLGDHDPSGLNMRHDITKRMNMFMKEDNGISVESVALNMDQIRELNLPPNPVKKEDTRSKKYIQQYGESCWELDALEPDYLIELVRNKILELRDEKFWNKEVKREQRMKKELKKICRYF